MRCSYRGIPRLGGLVVAMALLGSSLCCDRSCREKKPAAEPPPSGEPRKAPEHKPGAPQPPHASPGPDSSVTGMCQRVAEIVRREAEDHARRFARHGLVPPDRMELEIRLGPDVARCPRKSLMARRVREGLANELSRIEGLLLRDPAGTEEPDRLTLEVGIATDFDVASFRAVDCTFKLTLGGDRRVYRDRFDSEGLVCIRWQGKTEDSLIVRAAKKDFAIDLPVAPQQWFLLPRGRYSSITVRSRTRTCTPPSLVVGLQNLWALPGARAGAPEATARKPAVTEHTAGRERPRGLVILSPTEGQRVSRVITVSGRAYGLERATVRAIVIADGEYVQDHVGRVENGLWKVPGCIIGRAGRDSGNTFWIKARAQSPAGGLIVSETVAVVRK